VPFGNPLRFFGVTSREGILTDTGKLSRVSAGVRFFDGRLSQWREPCHRRSGTGAVRFLSGGETRKDGRWPGRWDLTTSNGPVTFVPK
jgi:hypothetical protein